MSENKIGQTIRIGVGVVGVVLFTVWCSLYLSDQHSQENFIRLVPTEVEPMTRDRTSLEGAILHFGIPAMVIGAEAALILLTTQAARRRATQVDKVFTKMPEPIRGRDAKESLPELITSDIDACLTPPARRMVNTRSAFRIRKYCDYARDRHEYPPLILVSARSQEYTELMCQLLGLIDAGRDVPCVLENGMALYWPHERIAKEPSYITSQMRDDMEAARTTLLAAFGSRYEFEPKKYMITVNVERQRAVFGEDLFKRQAVVQDLRILIHGEVFSQLPAVAPRLQITETINAVDIIPRGVSKLTGLQEVINAYNAHHQRSIDLSNVASIGNSEADTPILQAVGRPFCAGSEIESRLVISVVERVNRAGVLNEHNSEAVAKMIETVTGLKLP